MNELLLYIESLLKNPEDFHANRTAHEVKMQRILDHYADQRPPTIEQMIKELKSVYPALETNVELIEKGAGLRTQMINRVFAEDFDPAEIEKFDGQMKLFDRLVNFNSTLNSLLGNVSGALEFKSIRSSRGRSKVNATDTQGSAQRLLKDREGKEGDDQ